MLFNPGSVINKLFKIFCNKKTNFYASKWGFSPLKILKNRELQGGYAPLTPQRGRCPCTMPGACGPLEPRLIYGVNSHRLYLSGFLVHPHFHPWMWPNVMSMMSRTPCSWYYFFNSAFFYLTIVWICCPLITPHFLLHVWKMMKIW